MPLAQVRHGLSGRQRVDVWLACLPAEGDLAPAAAASLDDAERARAGRLRQASHRRLFVAAHAAQRAILARYAGIRPDRLQLTAGASGKPAPIALADGTPLHFNLSHAADWMALAVSPGGPVGMDIEQVLAREPLDELARVAFSAGEYRAWSRLRADQRLLGFHVGWTRKEAWLKSQGQGLGAALDGTEVSFRLDAQKVIQMPTCAGSRRCAITGASRLIDADPPLVATVVALGPAASIRWRLANPALGWTDRRPPPRGGATSLDPPPTPHCRP